MANDGNGLGSKYDLETAQGHKELLNDISSSTSSQLAKSTLNLSSPPSLQVSQLSHNQISMSSPKIQSVNQWLNTNSGFLKSALFDASAIVRVLIRDGNAFSNQSAANAWSHFAPITTTVVCYAEALNVLKRKYLKHLRGDVGPDSITMDQYRGAVYELHIMIEQKSLLIVGGMPSSTDVDECDSIILQNAGIDFSDALQIVALSKFNQGLDWILCTTDAQLGHVASTKYGLKVAQM